MRHTCSTCGYCKRGALLTEDPCKTCEVHTVNEFSNWHPIPITNADKIRSMSDEELAIWLAKSEFNHFDFFVRELEEHAHITVEYPRDETKLKEEILKWMKEEVSE